MSSAKRAIQLDRLMESLLEEERRLFRKDKNSPAGQAVLHCRLQLERLQRGIERRPRR
jgi:hypothetical protein